LVCFFIDFTHICIFLNDDSKVRIIDNSNTRIIILFVKCFLTSLRPKPGVYCLHCQLKLFGFDTYKGVYHTLFFQRKSLACDLMEPFRPLIDKEILKAYNLKQIDEKDFSFKNGSYSLSWKNQAKYSKIFLGMLVSQKSHIFRYIRDYYRYFMRPDKYKFPQTKI